MPKHPNLLKLNSVKHYIKTATQMRSSSQASTELIKRFTETIKKVIQDAAQSAKDDKRTTIMPRDAKAALDNVLNKNISDPVELFKSIKNLNLTVLGEFSKLLSDYIKQEKQKQSDE